MTDPDPPCGRAAAATALGSAAPSCRGTEKLSRSRDQLRAPAECRPGAGDELLPILDAKVTSIGDLLTAVKSFNGTPNQLRLYSTIARLPASACSSLVYWCWGHWKAC